MSRSSAEIARTCVSVGQLFAEKLSSEAFLLQGAEEKAKRERGRLFSIFGILSNYYYIRMYIGPDAGHIVVTLGAVLRT